MPLKTTDALQDPARVSALRRLRLLDTPPDEAFDRITRLAWRMLPVPIALVNLVDESRQFFKSAIGMRDLRDLPIGTGICSYAVTTRKPLVIEDARVDPRFSSNPIVTDYGLVAYIGIPLITAGGHALGTFCVVDPEPRAWRDEDFELMRDLAAIVVTEMDLRLTTLELEQKAEEAETASAEAEGTRRNVKDLVEGLDAIIWEVDMATGEFSFVSRRAEDILGYSAERWLEDPTFWRTYVHPEEQERVSELGRAAIAAGRDFEVEYRAVAADGRTLWLSDRVRVFVDAEGRTQRLRGVMTDVTVRKESETSYRSLFDSLEELVYVVDLDGHLLNVNEAMIRRFGYTREEALGREPAELLDLARSDREAVGVLWRKALAGEPQRFETWGLTKDGESFPQEVAFTMGQYFGAPVVIAIARDITERKRAETALRESEERFRQLAENIDSVFWLYDLVEQRILYVSPAYERVWGRPRETLYNDPSAWLETIHPEDRGKVIQVSREAIQGGFATEFRVVRPDGEVRTISDRGFPVYDERGEIIRAVGVAEDVTLLVETRRKLSEREAHYRRLVTTAPEGVYALDAEGRFVELNPAGEEMLERTAAELLGEHFARVVLPDDLGIAERVFADILSGAEAKVGFELRVIRPSGEHRLLQLTATGIQEGDRIVGLHGLARDITEERAREHTMRLLNAALESFEEGVSLATTDLEVLYANAAWSRILGVEGRAARDVDIRDLLPDEAAREQFREIQHALAEEGQWSGRVWRRRANDGEIIPLDLIAGTVEAPKGERNLFFVLHEATGAIEQESRLRRVERLASVGTLIGGVAHELNNPLHAIRSFADLMLLDEHDADDRESLEIMKREADRAAKVVSDLRLVARDTQAEKRQRAPVDLNDVVRHVLKLRRYSLETGNVEIREDLAEELPPVLANRGEVEQVLLNLIVNAEQAMAGQSGEKRLVLRTRRTGRGTSLHVVDSGPGIPAQHLDRIFDPFYTTKAPGEGTGLGLSLVYSIIAEHEGEIGVDSEPGKGTAFRIDLPRAPAVEESAPQESMASAPARRLRILVVDDEAAIRHVSVRFLERRGHQVDAVSEGGEALRLLEGADYDVIISDLKMPGLGGEELLARLREEGKGWERRLIFVTGDAASAQTARRTSETNVPMLIKPVRLEELAQAVEALADERT